MLEKKILSIEEHSIRRKSALFRKKLDDYSYLSRLIAADQPIQKQLNAKSRLVWKTMLGFFGCAEALSEQLASELPAEMPASDLTFNAVKNYSLHLSARYNCELLSSSINGFGLLRDATRMNIDLNRYSEVLPELIRYNLALMENNLGRNIILLQEFFFSKIIEATFRNSRQPSCSQFNRQLQYFSVSIGAENQLRFEGYALSEPASQKYVSCNENKINPENAENYNSPSNSLESEHLETAISGNAAKPPMDITFENIAGYQKLKEKFMDLKEILLGNNVYQKAGVPLPTGFLLYGPPGTGKTTLVYAFANECGWPFYELDLAKTLDMYVGESEKKVAAFLESKGILLLDEFDSLGRKKESLRGENSCALNINNIIAAKLNRYDPERILFAVTNNLDIIDRKLKGRRLSNVIFVDYPDEKDCAEIILAKLQRAENNSEGYNYSSVDCQALAQEMHSLARKFTGQHQYPSGPVGFSGADIEHIVYETIREKARGLLLGGKMVVPTTEDYLENIRSFDFLARQL